MSAAPSSAASRSLVSRVGHRDHARARSGRDLHGHQADATDPVDDDGVPEPDPGQARRVDDRHPAAGEHRRRLERDRFRQRDQVLRGHADDVRKPAVQREAELADGIGAERLAPGPAGGAAPAADEVVDRDAIALPDRAPRRRLENDPRALVSEHEPLVRRRDHSLEEVQLGAAHPGCPSGDERPAVGRRLLYLLDADTALLDQNGCLHHSSFTSGHCSQR